MSKKETNDEKLARWEREEEEHRKIETDRRQESVSTFKQMINDFRVEYDCYPWEYYSYKDGG